MRQRHLTTFLQLCWELYWEQKFALYVLSVLFAVYVLSVTCDDEVGATGHSMIIMIEMIEMIEMIIMIETFLMLVNI